MSKDMDDLVTWLEGKRYLIDDKSTTMIEAIETQNKWALSQNRMIRQTIAKIEELNKEKTVPFCMRCFTNSAVQIDGKTNFCHYCGSEDTCIDLTVDEAAYLGKNIRDAIRQTKRGGL